jgi:hypothetical protein
MKNNIELLIGFLIVPFVLFSQNLLPTAADADPNHQKLLAFGGDSSKSENSSIAALDEEPRLIKRVEPKYPAAMLKDRWEADIFLKVFVDINGNVTDVQSVQKKLLPYKSNEVQKKDSKVTDGKEFEDSAIAAARQWKFAPAQKIGTPVATWVTIPFRFRISTIEEVASKDSSLHDKYYKIFGSVRKTVENVLKGRNIEEVIQQHLNPDAYIIYRNKYASLYGVLKNEHPDIKLIEGEKSRLRFLNFSLSDDGTTLFITWISQITKSGTERYHTILFVKSKQDEWQIKHWHVSW